jgi:hypothetical protein
MTKKNKTINFVVVVPLLIKDEQAFILFLTKHLWIKKYLGILFVKTQFGLSDYAKKSIQNNDFELFEMPDNSLYDAWNQSLDHLNKLFIDQNFYLTFLGIDDELNEIFIRDNLQNINSLKYDFIFGDAVTTLNDRSRKIYPNSSPKLFSKGPFQFDIIHPGMLNRWELIKNYRFNTSYKLAADLDFYIRISLENEIKYLYISIVQALIGSDGISQNAKSKFVYKVEEKEISNKLSVIIIANTYRTLLLIFLARFPKLYILFRKIYWRIISIF